MNKETKKFFLIVLIAMALMFIYTYITYNNVYILNNKAAYVDTILEDMNMALDKMETKEYTLNAYRVSDDKVILDVKYSKKESELKLGKFTDSKLEEMHKKYESLIERKRCKLSFIIIYKDVNDVAFARTENLWKK
ncbi:MAG: hypothetical protein N4A47_04130 [Clostridia bacterium]|jgi:hypothetical protein|nr:hypothetical protein [Clostridia bacterium]